jgi:serine/tyrosine/threonine adenylyltransferase
VRDRARGRLSAVGRGDGGAAPGGRSLGAVTVAAPALFAFDNTFARELPELAEPWRPARVPDPRLLVLNEDLALELGADPAALAAPEGVAALAGNAVPEGAEPVAQAYAGHQFGMFQPRLGDGRAVLLGEVLDARGRRRDLHLKGSGRTPFARGGDGKAAVGPMLREVVIGEAMHALGIPTTRALAVVATGEPVRRETVLPGAVLARVAASHLRVGTFQYAAAHGDPALVRRLADHAIARHHPAAAGAEHPYLALFDAVLEAQASLVARWMLVGFVHGVMNTDNMTISGETIDFGPCAFMEAFDPATVFSSIDHGGRYAYGNQPHLAQWDLARLAETLLPLLADETPAAVERATAVLDTFAERFARHFRDGMRAKLGLREPRDGDGELIDDLLRALHAERADLTTSFRALAGALRGGAVPDGLGGWAGRWRERLAAEGADPHAAADAMDRVNPLYIPRNHRVEEALAAATAGDLDPFSRLLDVVRRPFDERPGLEAYAEPAPADDAPYVTFCGT